MGGGARAVRIGGSGVVIGRKGAGRGHSGALVGRGVQSLICSGCVLLLLYPGSLGCHTKRVVVCVMVDLHYDTLASLRLRCVRVFGLADGTPHGWNLVVISALRQSVWTNVSQAHQMILRILAIPDQTVITQDNGHISKSFTIIHY